MPTLPVASLPIQRCLSSRSISARVRKKSPPLQPARAEPIRRRARAGNERRAPENRIGSIAGILIPSGAPTTTAAGGCPLTLFRSAAIAGLVGVAVDPDNGKDQGGPHAIARCAIHAVIQAPRSRIRREIDDGAHFRSLWSPPAHDFAGGLPLLRTACGYRVFN